MNADLNLREERVRELADLIAAAMPPRRIEFSEQPPRHLEQIASLHRELDSVNQALMEALEGTPGNERAIGLTMVLQRTIRELGKQAGAI